jgi:hypothetical protein
MAPRTKKRAYPAPIRAKANERPADLVDIESFGPIAHSLHLKSELESNRQYSFRQPDAELLAMRKRGRLGQYL